MDVRCDRCGTDYEFDDALISERGTTVKCTNCSFQFKVFPSPLRAAGPERWTVRTASGTELVFTSLRDLQLGIAEGQVGPLDILSRGGEPPRTLSSIAELDHLFKHRTGTRREIKKTLHGITPADMVDSPEALAGERASYSDDTATIRLAGDGQVDALSETVSVASEEGHWTGSAEAVYATNDDPRLGHSSSEPSMDDFERAAERLLNRPEEMDLPDEPLYSETSLPGHVGAAFDGSEEVNQFYHPKPEEALPVPQAAERRPTPMRTPIEQAQSQEEPALSPPPAASANTEAFAAPPERAQGASSQLAHAAQLYDELTDPYYEAPSGRRAHARWIVLLVMIGAAGLAVFTLGQRYFQRFQQPTPPAEASSAAVLDLVKQGNKELDKGNLEAAHRELTKALAQAENDPSVLVALAKLEVVFADQLWLKARLLDEPEQKEELTASERLLAARIDRAERAVNRAIQVAPSDDAVLRARINLLRLQGRNAEARSQVSPILEQPSDPDNAYTLGILDLAEAAPVWSSVIDRLSAAAAAERELGRGRAALIYALVRDEKPEQAKAELLKLKSLNPEHLLVPELETYVERHSSEEQATDETDARGDDGSASTTERAKSEKTEATDKSKAEPEPEPEVDDTARDFRTKLAAAARALERGDLSRAEMLYRSVLKIQPDNVEALAGLADVERSRQNPTVAGRIYDEVLDKNPSYLPALLAKADQQWQSGDREGAVALYRQVLDQAGAGSEYGARALSRIEEHSRSKQTESESAPSEPQPPDDSPPPEQSEEPHIDTTDLPEYFE